MPLPCCRADAGRGAEAGRGSLRGRVTAFPGGTERPDLAGLLKARGDPAPPLHGYRIFI